jgi:hypothetical protein
MRGKVQMNVKTLVEDFLSAEEKGKGDPAPIVDFAKRQLKGKRADFVSALFLELALRKSKSLNQLVTKIVRSREWTYFVQDLRLEDAIKRLSKENGQIPIRFTISYPRRICKEQKATLRAYIYPPKSNEKDGNIQMERVNKTDHGKKKVITIIPKLQGCAFTPESISLEWKDSKRWVKFDIGITTKQPKFKFDRPRCGRVHFFMNSVAIGEIGFQIFLEKDSKREINEETHTKIMGNPYRTIFASYAYKDKVVVDYVINSVGDILGDDYVGAMKLKPGLNWREKIWEMIEEADIFQLFWSPNAEKSEEVTKEWEFALRCKKSCFIRPVYWIWPLESYPPPKELKHIHFTYIRERK